MRNPWSFSRISPPDARSVRAKRKVSAIVLAAMLPAICQAQPFFAKRIITSSADFATGVFAADLDNDFDLDVLSASGNDGVFAWYENDGQRPPQFTRHVISITPGAFAIIAHDLDGDDDMDVATAASASNLFAWYENIGGTPPIFVEHIISNNALGAYALVAINVDGDDDIDLVGSSINDDSVWWYESDGGKPPVFTEHNISTNANFAASIDAADLDGDLDIDVVSASFFDNKLAWYENDGQTPPGFTEHLVGVGSGARGVVAAEMNGDNFIDLVTATSNDNSVSWWRNNGLMPPTFNRRNIDQDSAFVRSVDVVDVNGDGFKDVLAASGRDNTIAWFENVGQGPLKFTKRIIDSNALQAYYVRSGDINGDGDVDVVAASRDDDTIAWYDQINVGDMNCSGNVDAFDIEPFILALFDPAGYEAGFPNCERRLADLNGDGTVDAFDIEPLLNLLFP